MNKTIKGGALMLFVARKSIACATSHTISVTMETKETTSKDSGGDWTTLEAGILSWSAKSENIASTGTNGYTYDDLVGLMIKREPITLVMGPKAQEGQDVPDGGWTPHEGKGRTGQAFITSVEENAPNGDNATFSVDFTGTGPLSPVEAVAAPANVAAAAPAKTAE
ncbi:hypothetical protein [Duncaniella muris]|uniref:hypothetical protein n=1 Tax=Duncaniella muris TaxID=2094150 RepID=UPI0026747314|nr:hypothetical protein [Duncaniella muris]